MHLPTLAGPGRRTRRALLAAALAAVLAAVALPSPAQAGNVSLESGRLFYVGADSENNNVSVRVVGSEIRIADAAGITSSSSACRVVSPVEAFCPLNVGSVSVFTMGGDDRVEYRVPHASFVDLGAGNDTLVAGTREAAGRTLQRVNHSGGSGRDVITYAAAVRGVSVTPEDGLANDGRPGDQESVNPDFETIIGSQFADAPLFGTPDNDIMMGLGGNDQIAGGFGSDQFISGSLDGADDYHGGPGDDAIDYDGRTRQLLIDLDNTGDDGELGENDNVRSNIEQVRGGSGNDVIKSLGPSSSGFSPVLAGRGGADILLGGFGPDMLIGGPGVDRLEGGAGGDQLIARDGEHDFVLCGAGNDRASVDSLIDSRDSCEGVDVGRLTIAPRAITAEAGKPARLRLSWRHPVGWRKLRTVALRLYRNGAPVGNVTIRPRAKRMTTDGAVALVRKRSRLTANGKTVSARLALRLDDSLAGQTLTAAVEATDTRGARQLETDAAKLHVAQ